MTRLKVSLKKVTCASNFRNLPSLAKAEGDAIEVYKYLKGIYKVDSTSMLRLAGPKTFKTRGHCLKIQKRYCRTKLRANFFGFRTVNMRNGLPVDVVLSPTLNSFKGRIDRHWLPLMIWLNCSDLINSKTYFNRDCNVTMMMMMIRIEKVTHTQFFFMSQNKFQEHIWGKQTKNVWVNTIYASEYYAEQVSQVKCAGHDGFLV